MCCPDEASVKLHILLATRVVVCEQTAKPQPKRLATYFREIFFDILRTWPTVYDIYISNIQITLPLVSLFFKITDISLSNTPGLG